MSDNLTFIETIPLPVELTNRNAGQGHHWGATAASRKKIEDILRKRFLTRSPFLHPVKIEITRILGKGQRLWDNDSIGRGNSKQLVDALVSCGWFSDDSPKFITECDYRQDASRRSQGPSVEISIWQSGPMFGQPTTREENKFPWI